MGKEKENGHRFGQKSVLDRLSCSRSVGAHSPRREHLTLLLKSPKEIFTLTKGKGIFCLPLKMQTPGHKRNKDHYCDYHEDHDHDTDECNDLKSEIKLCIQNGWLSRFIKRSMEDRVTKRYRKESRTRPTL